MSKRRQSAPEPAPKRSAIEAMSYDDDEEFDDPSTSGSEPEPEPEQPQQPQQPQRQGQRLIPTPDEKRALRETEDLFHTNIVRLQVAELLGEARPRYEGRAKLTAALHAIKAALEAAPAQAGVSTAPAGLRLHGYHKQPVTLDFLPPASVAVVGSFMARTAVRPRLCVDVAVGMPGACFAEKDYLNYQYHDKRALYLGVLARGPLAPFAPQVAALRGDAHRSPVLEMAVPGSKWRVRVLPALAPAEAPFPLRRLSPAHNNVRRHSFAAEPQQPSPHYTASILRDMFFAEHLQALHAAAERCEGLRDAVALAAIWLRQRALDAPVDGVAAFDVAMLLAQQLHTRALSRHLAPQQLFRKLVDLLSADGEEGLFVAFDAAQDLAPFRAAFAAAVVAPDGCANVWAHVSRGALAELRREAARARELLDADAGAAFPDLFLQRVPFTQRYDRYVRLPAPTPQSEADRSLELDSARTDLGPAQFWARRTHQLLEAGLTDRVTAVRALSDAPPAAWPLDGPAPPAAPAVTVGLAVAEAQREQRRVDRGPPADDAERAREWRALWQARSEIRRFKDGSIVEACDWGADTADVVSAIVAHLLRVHEPAAPAPGAARGAQLEAAAPAVSGTAAGTQLATVADQLARAVRQLRRLPLPVLSLQPAAAALRHAGDEPPAPHPLLSGDRAHVAGRKAAGTVVAPLRMVLRFEPSTRWPDKLEPLQHTVTAMLLALAKELQAQHGLRARLAPTELRDELDVFAGGFAFRLAVYHERGTALLRLANAPAAAAREVDLVRRPVHAAAMAGFYRQFPGCAPAVRLARHWLHRRALGDHLAVEAVELLVALGFCASGALPPARSAAAGFLRFLRLVADTDWAAGAPVLVDLQGALTPEVRRGAESSSSNSAMWLAGVYEADVVGGRAPEPLWTAALEPVVVRRLQAEAAASVVAAEAWLAGAGADAPPAALFRAPQRFDAELRLAPDVRRLQSWTRYRGARFSAQLYRNLIAADDAADAVRVGFDPVGELLALLRERFGGLALFFRDATQDARIGVVWRPAAFLPQPFSAMRAQNTLPVPALGDGKMVMPNIVQVLADMQALGEGVVGEVVVC